MKQELHTTPFNTGKYAQPETSEKIDKFTNRSKMKHSGGLNDPLRKALGYHPPIIPSGMQPFSHSKTSRPTGAHYSPAGTFGKITRTGAGQGVYSYGGNQYSAVPGNAIGSPPNRRGGNAVGVPPNRRGPNAVGSPPNRMGTNAVGNPPNRYGNNALASRFVPRGGGHKP